MNTTLRPTSFAGSPIRGADAGKDLALAELAGVELEAQQLVGAFDEFAGDDLADAQVELREIVDRDRRRPPQRRLTRPSDAPVASRSNARQ